MRETKRMARVLACLVALCLLAASCTKKVSPTTVKVKDPVRHYYPIITGQQLVVVYELENTGDDPLIIREIQPCCGTDADEDGKQVVILPGKKGNITLRYNSEKNVGFVQQKVWIYGNIKPEGVLELTYDVNVVPNADYTRDYEELYKERLDREKPVDEAVNGSTSQRGYYVNLEKDAR